MKIQIKSILSLCIAMLMLFTNAPLVMAMDEVGQSDESSTYVLAYYDIKTGVETMLTAKEAKNKFGLDVDSDTLAISTEPKRPTEKLVEKRLTEKEKEEVAEANKRGIEAFGKSNLLKDNIFDLRFKQNNLNQAKAATQITAADSETRTMVSNTNQFPYCCTAKIYTGSRWIGTGFAVGKNLLATARHCIQDSNGWASSVTAYFGFDNNTNTYFYKADNPVGYIYYPHEIVENSLEDWVFVVWGTNNADTTGTFGMSGAGYTGMPVRTMGYPQDLNEGNKMYECSGVITDCRDYDFNCDLRAYLGQSGSPVYEQGPNGPYAIAIITNSWFPGNGTNDAIARRIDNGLIGWLIENGYGQ